MCQASLSAHSVYKAKVSPLQTMKSTGDVDARVDICIATALRRGRVDSPTLGRLYPGESPRFSFYKRLSGPQDQSGHEGVKKNLQPLRHMGLNPVRPASSQAPCRLIYLVNLAILLLSLRTTQERQAVPWCGRCDVGDIGIDL